MRSAVRLPVLLSLALAACAHAPARPAAPAEAPVWPPPPAAPRARWVASLPAEAPRAEPSFWRMLGSALLGSAGSDEPEPGLVRPFGLAISNDAAVVADPDAPGLFRVAAAGPAQPIPCAGPGWGAPMAVAAGADGTLYVADAGAGTVLRVAPGGACTAWPQAGLVRPTGVALAAGRLYVVDPPIHQVAAFDLEGKPLMRFGEPGQGPGQLYFPTGIAAEADGSLLVVDALNFRVVRFSPEGAFLGSFGAPGDEDGELARPKAVAVDAAGRVFVSDAQRDVVLVFSPAGEFAFAIGEPGSGPGRLTLPSGVAVQGDRLLVANSQNHRIEWYQLLGDAP